MNASTQKILAVLENTSTERGACLSVRELSAITGYSESTVRRALKALNDAQRIIIGQSQGVTRNGGTTNCYRMTPPLSSDDTPSVISDDRPSAEAVIDPLPFDTPSVTMTPPLSSSTVEYVRDDAHAAGEQKQLQSSSALLSSDKAKQHAHTVSKAPAAQSILVEGEQFNPPPDAAPPPSLDAGDDAVDYWHTHLGMLTGGYHVRLVKAVKKHGLEAVQEAIDAAKVEGSRVQYKMSWIEARLDGEASKPKPAVGSHSQTAAQQQAEPEFKPFTGFQRAKPAPETMP